MKRDIKHSKIFISTNYYQSPNLLIISINLLICVEQLKFSILIFASDVTRVNAKWARGGKRYDTCGDRIRSNESLSLIKKRNGGIMRQSVESRRNVASLRGGYSLRGFIVWSRFESTIPSVSKVTIISCIPWRSTCFETLHRVLLLLLVTEASLALFNFCDRLTRTVSSCLLLQVLVKHDENWQDSTVKTTRIAQRRNV